MAASDEAEEAVGELPAVVDSVVVVAPLVGVVCAVRIRTSSSCEVAKLSFRRTRRWSR